MRTLQKLCSLSAIGATVALVARPVTAQSDISPPLPNVLLLIDSSGSMEYRVDGSEVVTCDADDLGSDRNRWTTLVEVLTGTVNERGCQTLERATSPASDPFEAEFTVAGIPPYDLGYALPYHRIVSHGCVAGPGTLPSNVFDWPAGAIAYRDHATGAPCTDWDQAKDGLLDTYRGRVRFGLMTFDSRESAGTGVVSNAMDVVTGFDGLWSYYNDWRGSGTPAKGNAAGCLLSEVGANYEVGARNAAALPWEGRMISLGRPSASTAELEAINDHIQEALIALRPYGATPLAGMMKDAYTFFREDTSTDPLDAGQPFAPAGDSFYVGGCRKSYIIVLSDGEPNLDLRPYCEYDDQDPHGSCPYAQPYETAAELADGTDKQVLTFAVGFGLSNPLKPDGVTTVDCNTLTKDNLATECAGATGGLKACCTLARMAIEGGTTRAYFPNTATELSTALAAVFAQVASSSTSRTLPSFAAAAAIGSDLAPAKAYEFVSSFEPLVSDSLWEGNLERKRWVCTGSGVDLAAELTTVDPAKGDDFAANVNTGSPARKFFTVVGDATAAGDPIYSTQTIRNFTTDPDGLGFYKGTPTGLLSRTDLVAAMEAAPRAMGIDAALDAAPKCKDPGILTAAELLSTTKDQLCALRAMNWELGGTNAGFTATRAGHELGAIFHSTPAVHGLPDDFLRDESYSVFARPDFAGKRPLMLYTATTDGQLHAFKVASNDPADVASEIAKVGTLANNELWAFLPPAVLPLLLSQYPTTPEVLLDGAPVVKDVVFERSPEEAIVGAVAGSAAAWSTVLVAGGGAKSAFYYALDVTDPTEPAFLWQLSTNAAGVPLFASSEAMPAIATIAYQEGTTDADGNPVTVVKEIAVAILPGGKASALAGSCARQNTSHDYITTDYPPRASVRCWPDGPARSLTIVRLSDGKVLKTFRGNTADGPATIDPFGLVKVVKFDSPITGTPVPYPSRPGQVSDRVYVGDADGTLWRINLASPDPSTWDANLVFDAYPFTDGAHQTTDPLATPSTADQFDSGQPVAVPPVVAVDGIGNTIVLFATGDQETFFTVDPLMRTRLWSITEQPYQPLPAETGHPPFKIEANWAIPFVQGKRVTGPLALFDTVAYFATFEPASNLCASGHGSVWGVDYLQSVEVSGLAYPLPRMEDTTTSPATTVRELVEDAGVVVFGVAVAQQPSCYAKDDTATDLYGTHTRITNSSAPVYQLVYQTGAGGLATEGAKTKTKSQVLPALSEMTRIDSWASIVE